MAALHGHGHSHSHAGTAPATRGAVIHWAGFYNFLAGGLLRKSDKPLAVLAGIKPGYKVLDAGCGPGNLSRAAEEIVGSTGEVYGIDASPEMIEIAQSKTKQLRSRVNFQVGLFEALPFAAQTFEVVISRLVIHHLPQDLRQPAFVEVLRVLKPGGQFFIIDFKIPKNRLLRGLIKRIPAIQPMLQVKIQSYVPILEAAGFKNIEVGETGFDMLAFIRAWKD